MDNTISNALEDDHMHPVVELLRRGSEVVPSPYQRTSSSYDRAPADSSARKSLKVKAKDSTCSSTAFKVPRKIHVPGKISALDSPAAIVEKSPSRRSRAARKPFQFLGLPPELRNKVYDCLLTTPNSIEVNPARQTLSVRSEKFAKCKTIKARRAFKTIFLEILQANKQVHQEATTVLYGNNVFKFRSDHKAGYRDPRRILPETYLGLIRRVKVTVISREADNGQESWVADLLEKVFLVDKTRLEMFELTWYGWQKFRLTEDGVLCRALLKLDAEKVFTVKISGDARMTTAMVKRLTDGAKARKVEIIRPVFEVLKDGNKVEVSDQE